MSMALENQFEVNVPIEEAWDFFMDPHRVVPCMPGARVVSVTDPHNWKVKAGVKLGSVKMTFKADVNVAEADRDNYRAVLKAEGKEAKGKGNVKADITSILEETESGGTRVRITTDMSISGKAAHFARGMVGDVADKFTADFAKNMEYTMAQEKGAESEKEAEAAAEAAKKAAEEAAAAQRALEEAEKAEAEQAVAAPPAESAGVPAGVDLAAIQALVARAEKAALKADAISKQVAAQVMAAEAATKRAEAAAQKAELAATEKPDTEVNGLRMFFFMVGRFFARLFGGVQSSGQKAA